MKKIIKDKGLIKRLIENEDIKQILNLEILIVKNHIPEKFIMYNPYNKLYTILIRDKYTTCYDRQLAIELYNYESQDSSVVWYTYLESEWAINND